jgi:hypothetical protein
VKIMVRTTIFAILLLGMAPAAFAATSQQGGAAQTFTFPTRYYDTARPGDIDGRLNITVYPSGIVNGFYLSSDSGRPVDVVGGVNGKTIWLNIGGADRVNPLHLTGTFENGVLNATVSKLGPGTHIFQSTDAKRVTS